MRDVHNGFYAVDHVRKLLVHGESFTPFSYWEFATELSEEPFSRSLHQSEDYVMQSWMPSVEQPCWSARRWKFKFTSITLRERASSSLLVLPIIETWIVNRRWYRTRSIGRPLILRDFWGAVASIVEMLARHRLLSFVDAEGRLEGEKEGREERGW